MLSNEIKGQSYLFCCNWEWKKITQQLNTGNIKERDREKKR